MGWAMLSWLRRRRERAERIDAKVKALIRAFGVDAHYVTSVCADFLVELRGFEPLTSAVRLQRSHLSYSPVARGSECPASHGFGRRRRRALK
jgi:hypothetical protein